MRTNSGWSMGVRFSPAPQKIMEQFITLTEKMRDAQKNYFRARRQQNQKAADEYLNESRSLERQVDEWIEKYKQGKTQPSLF